MLDRHDLTDEERTRLEPLLPGQKPQRGGRWPDHRTIIDGVFWRTRYGLPWRDVPPNYGHWQTVYNRHRRWSADGIWEDMLDELRRDADVVEGVEWTVGVDAGVVRSHQCAAGARHQPPADVDVEVLVPVDLDTGGGVESQEIRGHDSHVEGEAEPGGVGAVSGRV